VGGLLALSPFVLRNLLSLRRFDRHDDRPELVGERGEGDESEQGCEEKRDESPSHTRAPLLFGNIEGQRDERQEPGEQEKRSPIENQS